MKYGNCGGCRREITEKSSSCPYCGHAFVIVKGDGPPSEMKGPFTVEPVADPSSVVAKILAPAATATTAQPVSPIKPRERREVLVRIGTRHILDMVGLGLRPPTGYVYVPDFPQLPEGCTVRGPWSDPLSNSLAFAVEHPSFEVVPDGAPAPEWNGGLLGVQWKAVRVGDDNPAVLHFDTSAMTADERDRFRSLVEKLMVGDEAMIVTPRHHPPLSTREGVDRVISFCKGMIRQLEGTHADTGG